MLRAQLLLVFLLFTFLFPPVFSAKKNNVDIKVKKKTFKREEVGFKESWKNVKKGDDLFSQGKKYYAAALAYYELANAYNPNDPALNCKLGISYLYSDKKAKSLSHLLSAYQFDELIIPDINYYLGRSYQFNLEFDKAIEKYTTHLATMKKGEQKKSQAKIDKLIQECKNGSLLIGDPINAQVDNLGSSINSLYDDYNSIFSSTGQKMYYTSRRNNEKKMKNAQLGKRGDEDIYVSINEGGVWGRSSDMGKPVNNSQNNAALYISGDHEMLFIYNGDAKGGDIYASEFRKEKWRKPKPLQGKFNTKYRESTLNFSTDEGEIYFISNKKKNSVGGKDIYYSKIDERLKWSKPENMGDIINSPYDEESVFVSRDGTMLFFSSKGHNSMGGYDMFKCMKEDNGQWSKPKNMGYPVNTPENEMFYWFGEDGVGYYSAVREEGMGGMDIYKVVITEKEPEPIIEEVDSIIPQPIVVMDNTVLLEGMIKDSVTFAPVFAKIEVIDPDTNQVVSTIISDRLTGNYLMKLPIKKDYKVEITAQGYMFHNEQLNLMIEVGERVFSKDFYLNPLEIAKKVVLNNIFFANGKTTLSSKSYEELDRVYKLMLSTPTLVIEISGHTDNTGSYAINARLSKARAKAVVDYLVGKGVEFTRLKYEGYAYSQPIAPNDTPAGRQKNRRVEFMILSK